MRSNSTNVYLATLASADTLFLVCAFLMLTLPELVPTAAHCAIASLIPHLYPVTLTLQTWTLWIAMAFTVERCVAGALTCDTRIIQYSIVDVAIAITLTIL